MKWLNWYGLLFVAVILVPNIVFAATNADGFVNKFSNKKIEVLEQIGRFSCFAFMFVTIPGLSKGWLFSSAKKAYLIAGAVLVGLYVLGWIAF